MRKLAICLILGVLTSTAMAQHHHHHGHWERRGSGWGWVAPVIIGGVIGYEIARPPAPVIVQQPPVVVQQPPVVVQSQPVVVQGQNCSPWTQIQNPDGSITTTRTCQ